MNKILLIQFKFLGDVVFLTPILKALKKEFPNTEIHLLIPKEVSPIIENLNFIDKIWPFPRVRGKFNILESLLFVKMLRREKFDISIDFEGNDRGSLFSRLIAANIRAGAVRFNSSFFQRSAYNLKINTDNFPDSYIFSNQSLIEAALRFKFKTKLPRMELIPNKHLINLSKNIINCHFILCHISTTQEKKQWSLENWIKLFKLTEKYRLPLYFSAGPSNLEQEFLNKLIKKIPNANILKPLSDIRIFLALLSRADLIISNDSGPLHFAAALKVKIIGLFGPEDSVRRAAPIYNLNQKLLGKKCECLYDLGRKHHCSFSKKCIDTINPLDVFHLLKKQIKKSEISNFF